MELLLLQNKCNIKLEAMQERHTNRSKYFEEQAQTTRKYYIPYINKYISTAPSHVLEVGCGEGGNLLPFAMNGSKVVGVDYSVSRIEQAKQFFSERGQEGTFINSNIFAFKEYHHQFSLIIVHDVIEHIDDKKQFLSELKDFLSPGGCIFIAFPAWQMPFGGHQQIANGKFISHLPFVHLLPKGIYPFVLRSFHESEGTIKELLSIKHTRCTIEHFRQLTSETKYKVINQQLFLINPNYETKFGLHPRRLNKGLSHIPYIRDFFSTSCFYILQPETKVI